MTAVFLSAYTSPGSHSPAFESLLGALNFPGFALVRQPSGSGLRESFVGKQSPGVSAFAMNHCAQDERSNLTVQRAFPKVSLSGLSETASSATPENAPDSGNDDVGIHSRGLYVLSQQRAAGVCLGLDSASSSESRRPTRQTARWVFCFGANNNGHRWRSGQRAGLQNQYSRVQIPPGAPKIETSVLGNSASAKTSSLASWKVA